MFTGLDENALRELAERKRREAANARSEAILSAWAMTFACVLGAVGLWIMTGGQLPH